MGLNLHYGDIFLFLKLPPSALSAVSFGAGCGGHPYPTAPHRQRISSSAQGFSEELPLWSPVMKYPLGWPGALRLESQGGPCWTHLVKHSLQGGRGGHLSAFLGPYFTDEDTEASELRLGLLPRKSGFFWA